METLSSVFRDAIKQVVALSKPSTMVTEQTVYQTGQRETLPLIDGILKALLLLGSGINGIEHLYDLLSKAQAGNSCLLLLEHYSNLDLPIFSYLLRAAGARGTAVADALVAIAGMKLTEASPTVAAFTGAYTRIIIYPSRSLKTLDTEHNHEEIIRSNAINRAAMKTLLEIKTQGKLILVFPSGTRYRPWDPSTQKGVREIDSYIKSFDYMGFVAINGELLHVRKGDMMDDYVSQDVVRFTAGPVLSCRAFRDAARARAEAAGIADKKQAAVDAIMEGLKEMHDHAEEDRQRLLPL
ncbi:MAG: 1-acyl-sn-glycerol-3-phosphate acyltransferase [Treponema sp.]|jgi:glycerol-3-phosphate O-acyltransferase|nr:1-acyl-sn-glycerol-3-phosphate acyltransferase [Treponema sp.]